MSKQPTNEAGNSGRSVPARSRRERVRNTRLPIDAGASPGTPPDAASAEPEPRMTKQEHVLVLLSRKNGASIPEIMAVTDWQQHSVRGFFAGTVKKKLGFDLQSSKAEGKDRRYRIDAGRGK